MKRLVDLIVGNPAVLLWLALRREAEQKLFMS